MDSLTQIALGAAVGEATLGHRVGRRAMLWGAVCGTFPDLDVFIPLGDAVRDFTYHRSFSHSLFVLAALTPLFVWLILRCHPGTRELRNRWALLVYAVFVTHVLLDCFTVYGTQVLWPFVTTPVGWSTVFIIDPLYTLPLLAGLLALLVLRRNPHRARRLNTAGLVLSSLYLAWTVGAKLEVERAARASLAASGLDTAPLLSTPAPFNSLLWRVVVMTGDGYLEGFHSLLDGELPVRFSRRQSEPALLAGLQSHPPVQRLQWFTKGFYAVERVDDRVVISDLRMGMYPDYAFRFTVGEVSNPHSRPAAPGRWRAPVDYRGRLSRVWERIWDPGVRIN